MAEPAFAVPSDLMDSGSAPCDLGFMEVIGQKMRIPNRLKVTEEQGDEDKVEDIPLSTLQMQIPERISMGETEMQDIGARPYLYGWFHNNPSITDPPPLSISPNLMFGATHALNVDRPESPLQMATSQHSSRPRTLSENEICLASVSRRQRNLFKVIGRRIGGILRKPFSPRGWNLLPQLLVEVEILNSFKRYLDLHLKCCNLQDYGLGAGGWNWNGWLIIFSRCSHGGLNGPFLCLNFSMVQ
ncbi:uncharacterized protein LOC119952015 isoform X2 [Scyliorhinus canicula]|uniref:uncharacterized protein LOC119952015 isoform X2 n=1 Tax=Scyliorhinus canicula TaxID=7830 RepID=UPI0018F4427F|nr:uncharacterized protein LOC119952015 isoform X2 [Scyliorhinus canicula]